ncbi:putative sperm motility kinase W [Phodopus roborovskii]|uniref:putative sperm motility kinase W n=1 Tax=Phodopus roborovskii TaxID=109678 RepID=UPI0021E48D65|nr:putative sperm motility kinase W [Phodopus roborovskii]
MACLAKKDSLGRQYKLKGDIGQGAFGCVNLARHRFSGTRVAIKSVENLRERLRMIMAEIETLQLLQHPNIIQLFQIIVTKKHTYIITEYASGGNLAELVRKGGRLQEEKAQKLFGQMVSAIRYCHDRDIIHRDLKPHNILLDSEGNIKVADFGLARRCRAGTMLQGRCGTKLYNAPELIVRERLRREKGSSPKESDGNIIRGSYELPSHVSGKLENLIHQMLTVVPEKRPSIEDIEQHPWVVKCEEDLPDDTYLDPYILDLLDNLGFDANAILESLQKRNYDEMMGTYLIIKEQVRKGTELDFTTLPRHVGLVLTPTPLPARRLKRRASEPIFGILHRQASQPDRPKLLGRKLARSASLPQYGPQREIPTCSHAPLSRTSTATCLRGSILKEEMPLPRSLLTSLSEHFGPVAGFLGNASCFAPTSSFGMNLLMMVPESGRYGRANRQAPGKRVDLAARGTLSSGREGGISKSHTLSIATAALCICCSDISQWRGSVRAVVHGEQESRAWRGPSPDLSEVAMGHLSLRFLGILAQLWEVCRAGLSVQAMKPGTHFLGSARASPPVASRGQLFLHGPNSFLTYKE